VAGAGSGISPPPLQKPAQIAAYGLDCAESGGLDAGVMMHNATDFASERYWQAKAQEARNQAMDQNAMYLTEWFSLNTAGLAVPVAEKSRRNLLLLCP
jgi:hypothetical protein